MFPLVFDLEDLVVADLASSMAGEGNGFGHDIVDGCRAVVPELTEARGYDQPADHKKDEYTYT